MSDYPGAIDYPAHPTNVLGPPKNRPKGWCLHTPEEPADGDPGTPRWFARPNVGGSTTYFVSYLGFVFQCVPEDVGAIANGVTADRPYPPWADKNVSLNRQTLSVEIEGYAASIANTISPAQKTALLNLLAYGCEKYGFPKDRAHIIGHYQVASNRSDPGTLDIDAIVAELQTPVEEDDMFGDKDREKLEAVYKWADWQKNIAGLEQRFVRHGGGLFLLLVGSGASVTRHHIANERTGLLLGLNPDWSDVVTLTAAEAAAIPIGDPVPNLSP